MKDKNNNVESLPSSEQLETELIRVRYKERYKKI